MTRFRVVERTMAAMVVLIAIAALAGGAEQPRTEVAAGVVAANAECIWILDRLICPST